MEIVAGMILMCTMITSFEHGTVRMFVKDVETKVHHITPKGDALVQYNLTKHKTIVYHSDEDIYDIVAVSDMKRKGNMNCRKLTNEERNQLSKTR